MADGDIESGEELAISRGTRAGAPKRRLVDDASGDESQKEDIPPLAADPISKRAVKHGYAPQQVTGGREWIAKNPAASSTALAKKANEVKMFFQQKKLATEQALAGSAPPPRLPLATLSHSRSPRDDSSVEVAEESAELRDRKRKLGQLAQQRTDKRRSPPRERATAEPASPPAPSSPPAKVVLDVTSPISPSSRTAVIRIRPGRNGAPPTIARRIDLAQDEPTASDLNGGRRVSDVSGALQAAHDDTQLPVAAASRRLKRGDAPKSRGEQDEEAAEEDDDGDGSRPHGRASDAGSGGSAEEEDESDDIWKRLDDVITRCERIARTTEEKLQAKDSLVTEQPSNLQLKLKDYQLEGLNWLYLMHKENLSAILADEMGLGKTVQTIALLALLQLKELPGPYLIIVPSTTFDNWLREFSSWCPSLVVGAYHGSQKERSEFRQHYLTGRKTFDVLLTTYNLAFQKFDRPFLKKLRFQYMILDEAHNIKNTASIRHQRLLRFDAPRRLLLTGTPLQNNLQELCALLNFLMPDLFNDFHDLSKDKSFLRSDPELLERMKLLLRPFMLRRLKENVQRGLVPKREVVEKVQLEPTKQREIYMELLKHTSAEWGKAQRSLPTTEAEALDALDLDSKENLSKSFVNNIIIQLQKAVSHPCLLRAFYSRDQILQIAKVLHLQDKDYQFRDLAFVVQLVLSLTIDLPKDLEINSDFELHNVCCSYPTLNKLKLSPKQLFSSSGKILRLKTLLPQLKADGHRVLIFSQMTKVLDIIGLFLNQEKYTYLRIDGQTPVATRQSLIDTYNTQRDSHFIFLLSTKAGGLGINLTSADTVIFFDSSFNPQADRQAEDRAHRIGQTKAVTVYRLVSENTVEEYILQRAQDKLNLNNALLQEGKANASGKSSAGSDVALILERALRATNLLPAAAPTMAP